MKKAFTRSMTLAVVFLAAICFISSCATRYGSKDTASASPAPETVSPSASSSEPLNDINKLSAHILSEDEKKLANLLLMNANISVYDFNAGEGIKHVEVWYEVYTDGKPVRADTPLTGDIDKYNRSGSIAVVLGDGQALRLSLRYAAGAGQRVEDLPGSDSGSAPVLWTDTGEQSWATDITPGQDIAFLSYIGNTPDRMIELQGCNALTPVDYAQYKYVCIFKCRFTND
jgi:hypothetical protein